MRNIVDAIIEAIRYPKYELKEYSISHNRANQMGEALEEYIKDIFAGSVGVIDQNERNRLLNETFCYLGNVNNPPDSMLRNGGAAIEVKKIESSGSALALNSSYPKAKLYSDSGMINNQCRQCEQWVERDMIYAVGVIDGDRLRSLALVYGVDYCSEKSVYTRIKDIIKSGVESVSGIEFAETKELGRVNRVDPLGITSLRVRGMWHIENPFRVFDYIYKCDHTREFNLMSIINNDKIKDLGNFSDLEELAETTDGLLISDERIKTPDNPAVLRDVKLITYSV